METIYKNALQGLISNCPCCGGSDVYFKIIDEVTLKEVKPIKEQPFMEKVGCFTCGLNMVRKPNCRIINQWNNRK